MTLADVLLALVTLTIMEIVLGIDNVIFLAVVAGRLPHEQQAKARQVGLMVALGTRLLLLLTLTFLMSVGDVTAFHLSSLGIPASLLGKHGDEITWRDLILFAGGLFLIAKSTQEIHHKLEGHDETQATGPRVSFGWTIFQIALLDIVFSLDSVITAIGMARDIWVMVVAMIIAVGVMLFFAGAISDFVGRHPTVKMLALAFLILIGVMLVVEAFDKPIPKGYIYFAMAFSVVVEMLNLRMRARREKNTNTPPSTSTGA